MIKRTIYFGNPAYLSLKSDQLLIKLPEVERNESLPGSFKKEAMKTIPIEDLGVIVLDHKQVTITQGLMEKLLANNCALITCDESHLPVGLMLPLCGNTTQTERFHAQIGATQPLKKQLWQQTVQAKINNQATTLETTKKATVKNMRVWANDVKSGDSDNLEARASVYYWSNLFSEIPEFTRGREGIPPNNLLNYGYAILRAVVARALISSGMIPTLGIFHHNKYNAYCLADDIMEPYRPYVDKLIFEIMQSEKNISILNKQIKTKLLSVPVLDVNINNQRSPLMIAVSITTASLAKCYLGASRKIIYPEMR